MTGTIKDINVPIFQEAPTPFLYGPSRPSHHGLTRRCDTFLNARRVPRKLKKRFKRAGVWPPRSIWFRGLGSACLVQMARWLAPSLFAPTAGATHPALE